MEHLDKTVKRFVQSVVKNETIIRIYIQSLLQLLYIVYFFTYIEYDLPFDNSYTHYIRKGCGVLSKFCVVCKITRPIYKIIEDDNRKEILLDRIDYYLELKKEIINKLSKLSLFYDQFNNKDIKLESIEY